MVHFHLIRDIILLAAMRKILILIILLQIQKIIMRMSLTKAALVEASLAITKALLTRFTKTSYFSPHPEPSSSWFEFDLCLKAPALQAFAVVENHQLI